MIGIREARFGGLLLYLLMLLSIDSASAQSAARGRNLYTGSCAQCHSDPPGSGAVNPLVRTADEIRGAINRVSPMRTLGSTLSTADLVAALFRNTGPPFATAPGADAPSPRASNAGTVEFAFLDRETADVTFDLEGTRRSHRIRRVVYTQ